MRNVAKNKDKNDTWIVSHELNEQNRNCWPKTQTPLHVIFLMKSARLNALEKALSLNDKTEIYFCHSCPWLHTVKDIFMHMYDGNNNSRETVPEQDYL